MSLVNLANELLFAILGNLKSERDISGLARTSRSTYLVIKPYLYRHNVQKSGSSAFFWAAEHGQVATAQAALHAGADIETKTFTSSQPTALHLASAKGHTKIVSFLIRMGAQLDVEDVHAHTALHTAILYKHEPVARILIDSGADTGTNWPGFFNPTALHVASFYGLPSVVQLLLEKGADIEAKDAQMQTPLYWAVKLDVLCEEEFIIWNDPIRYFYDGRDKGSRERWKGNTKTVQLLLTNHANPHARDNSRGGLQKLTKNHPDADIRMIFSKVSTASSYDASLYAGGNVGAAAIAKRGETDRTGAKADVACRDHHKRSHGKRRGGGAKSQQKKSIASPM